jgi:hypothetical protein
MLDPGIAKWRNQRVALNSADMIHISDTEKVGKKYVIAPGTFF